MPFAKVEALNNVGFCTLSIKPLGPIQRNDKAPPKEEDDDNCNELPLHIGELLFTDVIIGVALITTSTLAVPDVQLFCVTVTK